MIEHIPNYDLYGEHRASSAVTGFHIEDIADRSKGRDWVIKPHRHSKLFQILFIFKGNANIQVDDTRHFLKGWSLISIPAGVVHGFSFEPKSEGIVITLSSENLAAILNQNDTDNLRPLLEAAIVIDLHDRPDRAAQLGQYIAMLQQEFASNTQQEQSALLLLTNLVLINIKRLLENQAVADTGTVQHVETTRNFRRLVAQHYKEQWPVNRYARELNMSTSTLNRACQKGLGTNAKSIIQDAVILEAKRRLTFTQQPLDQIAYHLGFKDPAYFSRLFKQAENTSPRDFRKIQQS